MISFESELERQRVAEVATRGRLDEPEMKPFKLVVWRPSTGRTERVVHAPSYNSAHHRYVDMAMFPHGTIATVEPL